MTQKDDTRVLVHSPADLANEYLEWAEYIQTTPGIPFGIKAIDEKVVPMRPGQLISIISRPGHGKTSVLAYLARQEATRIKERGMADKEAVVYVTWEQSAEELEAFFQTDGQYSISDIAWGRVDLDIVRKQAVKRAGVPIWVIGHGISRAGKKVPQMTPEVVLAAIETMRQDYGVRPVLMLFDYMQLVPVPHYRDRVQRVTEVPILIKQLALRIGTPAVVGVQASRRVDERLEKIPEINEAQWACLAGDAKLVNADTGEIITAANLWAKWEADGIDSFPIHSLTSGYQLKPSQIEATKRNAPEQVYHLECGNAGNIRANERHQFLTPQGFKPLSELKVGDWIALAKRLSISPERVDISSERAFVLGLLLGDGTLTRSLTLTNADEDILLSFREAVEKEWPDYTVEEHKQTAWDVYDSTIKRRDGRIFPGCNEPLNWARKVGVFGQTAESKHVPHLAMGRPEISALLSGLFSADGGVSFRYGRPQVTFSSCSEQLVNDVAYLLLRLGVSSTIRLQEQKGERKPLWYLRVSSTALYSFVRQIKMRGEKGTRLHKFMAENPKPFGRSMGDLLPPTWNLRAIETLKQHHLRTRFNNVKGRAVTRGRMLRVARATGSKELLDYATCELKWAKITAIEPHGIEHTYDFCVPNGETFVANNFVVHNSSIEQTSDKIFGLWRPSQTEELGKFVELSNGKRYEVTERLFILRMLKQRGDIGRWTWALHFQMEYLKLAELETRHNEFKPLDF